MSEYLHGYSTKEQDRLLSQNVHLSPFIYKNIDLSPIENILEVGCGVGAQMIYILENYPNIKVTGVDISLEQIKTASKNLHRSGIDKDRYEILHISDLQEEYTSSFDSLIMVWVLEHVADPVELLSYYKKYLKQKGKIFLTEVYNNSLELYPHFDSVKELWNILNQAQEDMQGNGNVGIHLGKYLQLAGFNSVEKKAVPLFLDQNDQLLSPAHIEYWKQLMLSSAYTLQDKGIVSDELILQFEKDMESLKKDPESVFYYSFIQATAER